MILTLEHVKDIRTEAMGRVNLSCDKCHVHTFLDNCFAGGRDVITVGRLCEAIVGLHDRMDEIISTIKDA